MKKGLKILFACMAVLLFAAVLVLIHGSSAADRHLVTCNGLDIQLPREGHFVTESDIQQYLKDYYGPYIGERIDSVDLSRVEAALDSRSAIRKAEAWTTPDGILHISITQRKPVVRLQKDGVGLYADDRGFLFPLQSSYSPMVPIVDGALPLNIGKGYKGEAAGEEEKEWLSGLIDLLAYMKRSKVWDENISQITVQPDGDLVMYPREGRERFIFGSTADAAKKFSRMEDYYKYIKPAKDSAYYASVNVKYDGQIICRQK